MMERLTKRWLVTQFAESVEKILALLEIGENKNELAIPNTSTNTVDTEANQRTRATTTRTTSRGSVMTPPKEIWLVESPTAFWFSREPVHDLPDDCVVTHMVPAQPEQEPVAQWLEDAFREGWASCRDAEFVGEDEEDWKFGNSTANSRMIDMQQSTSPQRTWVALTDEQHEALMRGKSTLDYGRSVEAAHGIKE